MTWRTGVVAPPAQVVVSSVLLLLPEGFLPSSCPIRIDARASPMDRVTGGTVQRREVIPDYWH